MWNYIKFRRIIVEELFRIWGLLSFVVVARTKENAEKQNLQMFCKKCSPNKDP